MLPRLLAFVLPLGVDSFAVAAALRPAGLAAGGGNRPRHRISEWLTERAEQVAAVALILLGAYLIADRLRTR
jgi:hypothetical protein